MASTARAAGTLHTDRTFTGQIADATGLLYYNARVCDPALGTFISFDSLVPDAGIVIDYDRFHYAREKPATCSYIYPEWAVLKGSRDNPTKLPGKSGRAFPADRSTSLQKVVNQAKCH